MDLKFKVGNYLKNIHDCCDFLEVLQYEEEADRGVRLKVIFYTRLHEGFKQVSTPVWISIFKKDFKKWTPYLPRGTRNDV
jgi:hypothetical protein